MAWHGGFFFCCFIMMRWGRVNLTPLIFHKAYFVVGWHGLLITNTFAWTLISGLEVPSDRIGLSESWDYEVPQERCSFILYRAVDGKYIWSGFVGDNLAPAAGFWNTIFIFFMSLSRYSLRWLRLLNHCWSFLRPLVSDYERGDCQNTSWKSVVTSVFPIRDQTPAPRTRFLLNPRHLYYAHDLSTNNQADCAGN